MSLSSSPLVVDDEDGADGVEGVDDEELEDEDVLGFGGGGLTASWTIAWILA